MTGPTPRLTAIPIVLLALTVAGCGSVRTADQSGGQDAVRGGAAGFKPFQPRDRLIECLREKGVEAVAKGEDEIQVLPASTGPRIVMAADPEAATALQVRGKAEGAELMGRALVYAGRSSDAQVEQVQDCLLTS